MTADEELRRALDGDTAALKLLLGRTPGQADWLRPVTLPDIEAALAARSEPRADGLREALTQARDRLDDIFHAMHPGDYTEDELHGIAQNAYFGSEEIDRALAATPPAEGLDVHDHSAGRFLWCRDCLAEGASRARAVDDGLVEWDESIPTREGT